MRWNRANDLARRALGQGWKVRIKTFFADVLVANEDGDFVLVQQRVRPQDAFVFHQRWFKSERHSACVLWPHGLPIPAKWKILD